MKVESDIWWVVAALLGLGLLSCGTGSASTDTGSSGGSDGVLHFAPTDSGSAEFPSGDALSDLQAGDGQMDAAPPIPELLAELVDAGGIASPDMESVAEFVDVVPPPEVDLTSPCSVAGDGKYNIFDLQDPSCPDHPTPEPTGPPGLDVELEGVVVSARFSKTFFVQEPQGGPWSGIAIYSHGMNTSQLSPGTVVDVKGAFQDFFGLSEVYLDELTVISEGVEPTPYIIDYPDYIATDGALAEAFEAVLVRVETVTVTNTKPDCPHEFGEFMVTGKLRVDDMGSVTYEPDVGDELGYVTGPLNYAFGNSKLEPRNDGDIKVNDKSNGGATKCINVDCIVALDYEESGVLVINEIMFRPVGLDIYMEWFEVYNPGSQPVNMSNWKLRDCAMLEVFLPEGQAPVVEPKGYVVFGPEDDHNVNGGVELAYKYSQEAFYLPNTEGSILLFDQQNKLVDQVRYASFGAWPGFPGASLELDDPALDNLMPDNWTPGSVKYGPTENEGTPGAENTAAQ